MSGVEVKYFTVSGVDLKITVSSVECRLGIINIFQSILYFSVFLKVGVECRDEF